MSYLAPGYEIPQFEIEYLNSISISDYFGAVIVWIW